MRFPDHEEVMPCPHCGGRCAFCRLNPPQQHATSYSAKGPDSQEVHHLFFIAYCRTCTKPIIKYESRTPEGSQAEVVYPKGSPREKAPLEVRKKSAELANDYDEAVACEPHSLQATALLLGRCASEILIAQCEAEKASTLGIQIREAIAQKKLPNDIAEEIEGLEHRNQAAHPWYAPTGQHLKIDEDAVDWCFEIIGLMFDRFYIEPVQRAARKAKLKALKSEKKAGDKA